MGFSFRRRAFVLSSFCRFSATAKRAAVAASAINSGGPGGSAELMRAWQRCRQADFGLRTGGNRGLLFKVPQ